MEWEGELFLDAAEGETYKLGSSKNRQLKAILVWSQQKSETARMEEV